MNPYWVLDWIIRILGISCGIPVIVPLLILGLPGEAASYLAMAIFVGAWIYSVEDPLEKKRHIK